MIVIIGAGGETSRRIIQLARETGYRIAPRGTSAGPLEGDIGRVGGWL